MRSPFLVKFFRCLYQPLFSFFFFTDPATTEIYTLSLHDALPISYQDGAWVNQDVTVTFTCADQGGDRKSTRLNSSHRTTSYAVFGLKKKKRRAHHFLFPHRYLPPPQCRILPPALAF